MEKELSASKAGFPCMLNLWYTVNGYGMDGETDKRTQRIFDVGTALEPVAVDWLRQDGWTVEYNPGSQKAELKVSIPVRGGMLTGHPDCIISKGEIQNALVDINTMNDRAFTLWKREGTQKSKPQYAMQLQLRRNPSAMARPKGKPRPIKTNERRRGIMEYTRKTAIMAETA